MLSLIQKYLEGKASPEEEQRLFCWLEEGDANKETYKHEVRLWSYAQKKENSFSPDEAFEALQKKIGALPKKKEGNRFKIKKIYKYAAVLLIGLLSVYFYADRFNNWQQENAVVNAKEEERTGNIILSRGDGKQEIIPAQREQLSYISHGGAKEKSIYNMLKIPRGRVFKIILSDSTKVWLNADTRIKYPEKFLPFEKTRTVYLEGEAFFEVAHNKEQPFIVKSGNLEIEVLGTEFNVSSYRSGTHINTTLVNGSVKVSDTDSKSAPVVLKPSYQATYNKATANMEVLKVYTDDFTAWMDKRIVFYNEPFRDIILKIERTYNVDIVNKLPEIEGDHFTGEFGGESIEDILKTINRSIDFNYKTEDGKIIIY